MAKKRYIFAVAEGTTHDAADGAWSAAVPPGTTHDGTAPGSLVLELGKHKKRVHVRTDHEGNLLLEVSE